MKNGERRRRGGKKKLAGCVEVGVPRVCSVCVYIRAGVHL